MKVPRILKANLENLGQKYGENTVKYYQAVFLSNLGRSFAFMLIAIHLIILFPGTGYMDDQTKLWLAPFIGLLVAILTGSAWLVENGNHRAARYVTNFAISASTVLSVIFCGGFIASHATPFLLAPIVVCFCISPRIEAFIVGTITFFFPLFFDLLVRLNGWIIRDYTSGANPEINVIFLMATLFVTVFISLNYLQQTSADLHEALDAEKSVYKKWASVDPLTEIGNRRFFDMQLEAEVRKAASEDKPFALLFLDLNGFKDINDRFGHEAGDQLLRIVAKRLENVVRDTDHLARLGGDEFGVIIATPSDGPLASNQARRIERIIENPIHVEGVDHMISASIGKAVFPDDALTPSELVRAADVDMYTHKLSRKLLKQHDSLRGKYPA